MIFPELSILVISYNTREMTLECLRSVFRETRTRNFEIIVLDNASTDGSPQAIAEEFGDLISLIISQDNLGFACGNNRAAGQGHGEFLLLLNPDTVVLEGAIDRLLMFARSRPDAGIWGGRTLFGNRLLNPASCWARQTLWSLFCQAIGLTSLFRRSSLFNPEGMGGWDRSGIRSVDIVSGCFLLVRHDLWIRLGGFRQEFFMYGEEADLCLRARNFGARPMVSSAATIIHHGGASETVRADKLVRLLSAKMRVVQYHFPVYTKSLGCWLLSLWPVTRYWAQIMLSRIVRRSPSDKLAVWREVVRRRNEWYYLL
jgi:N-acetylglucosaminyl-diphospho-decaprenol L-rhamnosyltransferase